MLQKNILRKIFAEKTMLEIQAQPMKTCKISFFGNFVFFSEVTGLS